MIPKELLQDRYWKGLLHIFSQNQKLNQFITSHIDFDELSINATGLIKLSSPWSPSEKFMLNLALHLYNENYTFNLSDMDRLDPINKKIAFKAIQMRFA
ncbi:hypothetical protein [Paenibacillus sp. DMB20]|uniref:hypothetical protein n=1 Tax=Paenibacillus sp. DMB20 TaxID=1642570 RepID=UPI0006274E2B|nr:hypothetical protein [Paenibacillus sp. DMB20]KKO51986.1 hypothetical protein XI25_21145 [Paenibacillus sp. DMB20]